MGFIRALHRGLDGCDIIETIHDGQFHRNRRLKQSDGDAHNLYK